MSHIARELATPPGGSDFLHPRENVFIAGNLGALNAEIVLAVDGCASFALDLRGTFNLTVELSGSVDGTNFVPIPVRALNVAGLAYLATVAGAVPGVWVGKCAPFRIIRARVTAFTSGSAVATLAGDTAPLDDSLQDKITPGLGTITAASGAATTLTLANPGAGLRHYITYIEIQRIAAAALIANAAPTVITTTNVPGALAFSLGQNVAQIGDEKVLREGFTLPLGVSAQNAGTTIVAPATTGVIWRLTAGFYVAP